MVHIHNRRELSQLSLIPVKANRLLQIILFLLIIVLIKLWHLTVIQHKSRHTEALRSRTKTVVEPAYRGTIRDRFNILLAHNKIAYRATIVYTHMKDIPLVVFEASDSGAKRKRYLRREYVHTLSQKIAHILQLDPNRIEDEIHAYAAFYGHVPYVIKDRISEKEYYQLRMLEKDFPGLVCQRYPRRNYPCGKVGSHVIGYVGPLSKDRYEAILHETKMLERYIKEVEDHVIEEPELPPNINSLEEAQQRLTELQEKAYTISDHVGILGVEQSFEEQLRGFVGKKKYFSNAAGSGLRQLPGSRAPVHGKRLYLSISKELQEYAEELLIQTEPTRALRTKSDLKMPWIRGGAIVAMDPITGEVLALASSPRFDANDFVNSSNAGNWWNNPVLPWVKNENTIAAIWDGLISLRRESYNRHQGVYDDFHLLSWNTFLELILPQKSLLLEKLHENVVLKNLMDAQKAFSDICATSPGMSPADIMNLIYSTKTVRDPDMTLFLTDIDPYKKILDRIFEGLHSNQERLLYIDLSRLVVDQNNVSEGMYPQVARFTIGQFRKLTMEYVSLVGEIKKEVKRAFHEHAFSTFRNEYGKQFLHNKRIEEKHRKIVSKPYLDYFDAEEKRMFEKFWSLWKPFLIEYALLQESSLSVKKQKQLEPYFSVIEGALVSTNLDTVLKKIAQEHRIPFLRLFRSFFDLRENLSGSYRKFTTQKDLAAAFSGVYGPSFCTSFAYRSPSAQGSIFKLVTSYAALCQKYKETQGVDVSLFEIEDKVFQRDGRTYVGFFADGTPIPQLYKGNRIPKSLNKNIGKIDLLRALEYSSDPYFALLAGDFLMHSADLCRAAQQFGYGTKSGIQLPYESKGAVPDSLENDKTGLYAFSIGQGQFSVTPVQSACMLSAIANGGRLLRPKIERLLVGKSIMSQTKDAPVVTVSTTEIRDTLFLPDVVRRQLLLGMQRVVKRLSKSEASDTHTFVGKSSTAESREKITEFSDFAIYNHTWFGGVSFNKKVPFLFCDSFGQPELVVIVFLRYGRVGSDVFPFAERMVQKWRTIQAKYRMTAE